MGEIIVYLLVFLLMIGVIYGICLLIAIPMVKKRVLMAKRIVVGKENSSVIEFLKNIAKEIFDKSMLQFAQLNDNNYRICINMDEDKKLSKVTLKNNLVSINYNGEEYTVTHLGFDTEKSAIFFIARDLFCYILMTLSCFIFLSLIIGVCLVLLLLL